jgi:2-alkenal reductase
VNRVVPSLLKTGQYNHPYLGINGTSLQPAIAQSMNLKTEQRGVLVEDVATGGPAAKAGLQGGSQQIALDGDTVTVGGDVIVSVDGHAVNTFNDMLTYLERNTSPGQSVTLGILRGGKAMSIQLTLGARPASGLSGIIPGAFNAPSSSLTTSE